MINNLKIIIQNIIGLMIIINTASCQGDTEDFLKEMWGIQEIYFEGENVKGDFSTNLLYIEDDNICEVPFLNTIDMSKEDRFGTWSFNKDTRKLTIESKNPYLNGEFDVCFEKNTEYKRIMLVLTSDKVSLKASRGITQYQGDGGELPITCDSSKKEI